MRLTDELVEKFDKAETIEEKKAILSQAEIELTDDELEIVSGGTEDSEIKYVKCGGCGWKMPYFWRIKENYFKALEYYEVHKLACKATFPFGPR